MKYKVTETYTPEDTNRDRKHLETEFTSDSKDLYQLAVEARYACHPEELRTGDLIENIKRTLDYSRITEQFEEQLETKTAEQLQTSFSFIIIGSWGDWNITVEAIA